MAIITIKPLLKEIKEKKIITITSLQGGVDKSVIAYGIALSLNVPFITNDKASVFYASKKKKYEHIYKADKFTNDEFFIESDAVVIDLSICIDGDDTHSINTILSESNLIIIPSGSTYLELQGTVLAAINLKKYENKMMFLYTNESNKVIKKNRDLIKDTLASVTTNVSLFDFRKSNLTDKAILDMRSYEAYYGSLTPLLQKNYSPFIKEWTILMNKVKNLLQINKG